MTDASEPTPVPAQSLEKNELRALVEGLPGAAGTSEPCPRRWSRFRFEEACRELSVGESRRWGLRSGSAAAATATRLSALLERPIQVDALDAGVRDFAEFDRSRSTETPLYSVETRNPEGRYLVTMSPQLLFAIVDILLGSAQPMPTVEARRLSALEAEVASAALHEILAAHAEAWSLGEPGEIEDQLGEGRHRETCRPADPVALLTQGVHISNGNGPAIEGDLQVAVPPGTLLTHACRPESRSDEGSRRSLPPDSGQSPEIELVIDLESAPLRLTDLLALRPNDVIDTGLRPDSPLRVRAREHSANRDGSAPLTETRWRGRMGRQGERLAARLERP